MEYTDAPSTVSQTAPLDPASIGKLETAEGQASDAMAVLLSVVPGLGHIYKGHKFIGMLLVFVGTPIAVALAALIATGTAGFGIALLPIYWFSVMFHVYGIEDAVGPRATDDGEQY